MAEALKGLEPKLTRYTLIIRRSLFSDEVAESGNANLIIFQGEPLISGDEINQVILKSKSIVLIGYFRDGGIIVINLTTRRVQSLYGSAEAKEAIEAFRKRLLEKARSRWTASAAIGALVWLPLVALLVPVFTDEEINQRVYNEMSNTSRYQAVHFDKWVGPAEIDIFAVAIFSVLAAIVLGGIRLWSGPLKVWPEKMTSKSFIAAIRSLRVSSTLRNNLVTITASVIAGLLIAFFTRLL